MASQYGELATTAAAAYFTGGASLAAGAGGAGASAPGSSSGALGDIDFGGFGGISFGGASSGIDSRWLIGGGVVVALLFVVLMTSRGR